MVLKFEVILLISGKYHRAFILSIFISLNYLTISLFTLIYHDPRPSWISNKIQIQDCNFKFSGFGNPSGGAISAAIFGFSVSFEFGKNGIVFGMFWGIIVGVD